jgi:hypothetical protein
MSERFCSVADCPNPKLNNTPVGPLCSKHYQRYRRRGSVDSVAKPHAYTKKITGAPCTVGECTNPVVVRGMCGAHYQRNVKHGNPSTLLLDRSRTPEERFWSFVDKNGPEAFHSQTGKPIGKCWNWSGGVSDGYGMLWLNKKNIHAHRFSYRLYRGATPDGLELDHLCRNRSCSNPAHLEPVTHKENVRRGESPSAVARRTKRCKIGHEYEPSSGPGPRGCQTCRYWHTEAHNAKIRNRPFEQLALFPVSWVRTE